MRIFVAIQLILVCLLIASCGSPEPKKQESAPQGPTGKALGPANTPQTSTFQGPGGKTLEIKMESGIKDSEVGLPRYPAIKSFIGPSSYSKRTGPASIDYEIDFETVDSMAEVEKFYSKSFKILNRQSGPGRISIAGKQNGMTYSVTATRPASSQATQVNIRAFRKK